MLVRLNFILFYHMLLIFGRCFLSTSGFECAWQCVWLLLIGQTDKCDFSTAIRSIVVTALVVLVTRWRDRLINQLSINIYFVSCRWGNLLLSGDSTMLRAVHKLYLALELFILFRCCGQYLHLYIVLWWVFLAFCVALDQVFMRHQVIVFVVVVLKSSLQLVDR